MGEPLGSLPQEVLGEPHMRTFSEWWARLLAHDPEPHSAEGDQYTKLLCSVSTSALARTYAWTSRLSSSAGFKSVDAELVYSSLVGEVLWPILSPLFLGTLGMTRVGDAAWTNWHVACDAKLLKVAPNSASIKLDTRAKLFKAKASKKRSHWKNETLNAFTSAMVSKHDEQKVDLDWGAWVDVIVKTANSKFNWQSWTWDQLIAIEHFEAWCHNNFDTYLVVGKRQNTDETAGPRKRPRVIDENSEGDENGVEDGEHSTDGDIEESPPPKRKRTAETGDNRGQPAKKSARRK